MNELRFSNNFSEKRVSSCLQSLERSVLLLLSPSFIRFKTFKTQNEYFYIRSLFEHGFLINLPSRMLQMPAVSCISKSDEGEAHCKIEYNAPRFCGSSVLRCTLCGTPLLFLKEAKNASATALSCGRAVAEKDCFTPHFCRRFVNAGEVYCFPRSL